MATTIPIRLQIASACDHLLTAISASFLTTTDFEESPSFHYLQYLKHIALDECKRHERVNTILLVERLKTYRLAAEHFDFLVLFDDVEFELKKFDELINGLESFSFSGIKPC